MSTWGQDSLLTVSGEFRGQSLRELIVHIESISTYRFYYKDDWIDGITLKTNYRDAGIFEILDRELEGQDLSYYHDGSHKIFFTGPYTIRTQFWEPGSDTLGITVHYAEAEIEAEPHPEYTEIDIGTLSENNGEKVTISGYIKDVETGEPVIGAVVYATEVNTATVSNQYGYYALTIPRGSYQLRYTCLGMRETTRHVNVYGPGTMNVEMQVRLIPLRGVTVTANTDVALTRMEVGLEKLSMQSIQLLPTSMGEPDVISSVLLLPGVQTVGEGSQGFNVRGGSTDQNLILLYDAPIFNPSHFFGFFSAVNGEIVRDLSLYKGGIPAQYGGRISSVMDITARDGNNKKISGGGGISPVTAHLMLEGPIIKEKGSFLLAGRSTYSNWLLGLIEDPSVQNSKASFFDINARFVQEIDEKNKVELSAYLSHDAFKFNQDTLYRYDNRIVSLKWRRVITKKLFSVYSANYSGYEYSVSSDQDPLNAFNLDHRIHFGNLKTDFTFYPEARHKIDFGLNLGGTILDPGILKPTNDSSQVIPTVIQRQNALEYAVYVNDEFQVSDRLMVSAGLRLSGFSAFGPGTVLEYDPAFSMAEASVTDTLNFGAGRHIKSYFGPELRLGLNYRINSSVSFKLNYNRTRQHIHLLSNTASISPTDIWILSDYHLKPQVGDQFALGFYKNFRENIIETSIEGYYKIIRNMIDFKGGATLLLNEQIETDVVNTRGRAYGVEIMIKKPKGRLNGWASYTYSRILMRSVTPFPEDEINDGDFFPANYDKPHSLTVVASYLVSRRLSFSTTYSYSTGRPITYPVASYDFYGARLLHYSDRNQYRIPDYSRLDFSLTLSGNLKSRKLAHSTLTFSVFNVLGRENVYSIYFQNDGVNLKGYQLSIFARPIPSLTYTFKF
jgi:hypothetical protein